MKTKQLIADIKALDYRDLGKVNNDYDSKGRP